MLGKLHRASLRSRVVGWRYQSSSAAFSAVPIEVDESPPRATSDFNHPSSFKRRDDLRSNFLHQKDFKPQFKPKAVPIQQPQPMRKPPDPENTEQPRPSSSPVIHSYLAPDEHLTSISSSKDNIKTANDYDSLESFFKAENIHSRPQRNWNPHDPLQWTTTFGSRSPDYETLLHNQVKIRKGPGDEGYYDVSDMRVPGITLVRTKEQAAIVLEQLNNADPRIYHACDTEVMDIELKSVGPVGNGYVTCASIYSGPEFDYGLGDGPGTALVIDNLDDACGILQEFKDWFENERYLKVWHNYGFDRHVMFNEGINVRGFGGDTMHMARLQDTSRLSFGLEALTAELLERKKEPMKSLFGIRRINKDGKEGAMVDVPPVEELQRNPRHRAKWLQYSGYDAKGTWLLRNKLEELLRATPWLRGRNLFDYYWMHMRLFGEVLTEMERYGIRVDDTEYLASVEQIAKADRERHRAAFSKWAEDQIGADGVALNTASSVQLQTFLFGGAKNIKTKEVTEKVRTFSVPRKEVSQEALDAFELRDKKLKAAKEEKDGANESPKLAFDINGESIHLENMKATDIKNILREKGLPLSGKKSDLQERLRDHVIEEAKRKIDGSAPKDNFESMKVADLKDTLKSRALSIKGNKAELVERLRADIQQCMQIVEMKKREAPTHLEMRDAVLEVMENMVTNSQAFQDFAAEQKKKMETPTSKVDVTITSLGLDPVKYTTGGSPSVTADVLKTLAGDPFADPPKYGTAFEKLGKEGCEAIFNLCAIGSIDTMISNFITSLQELADHESRVHCALNLNTETGRLSSRRPNLQNQPALEKDKYKIRQAFQASPGNNLIVCDYGQLELRILASITKCKSMIDAFAAGGDFHSRTAVDMFPYVKQKLDDGDCLLEWDYSKGDPPKPLLKEEFASERRKAKTLNFSIAYGKTAHGLSKDWGVSIEEAEEMLQAWYAARPEVREWQANTKQFARSKGITRTLMGRYRQLPQVKSDNRYGRPNFGRIERASINTPIQGGAADVVMMSMCKIHKSKKLKQLGWILLLQIHDEVILEGPEETAEEAFTEVKKCMEEPWVFGLPKTAVPLTVDGSYTHKSWYDAK